MGSEWNKKRPLRGRRIKIPFSYIANLSRIALCIACMPASVGQSACACTATWRGGGITAAPYCKAAAQWRWLTAETARRANTLLRLEPPVNLSFGNSPRNSTFGCLKFKLLSVACACVCAAGARGRGRAREGRAREGGNGSERKARERGGQPQLDRFNTSATTCVLADRHSVQRDADHAEHAARRGRRFRVSD